MRHAGWVLFGLLAVGWAASEVEVSSSAETIDCDAGWRRTADGWEWSGIWEPVPKEYEPAVHPLVVGTLQVLLSVLALVALPARNGGRRARGWNRRRAGKKLRSRVSTQAV